MELDILRRIIQEAECLAQYCMVNFNMLIGTELSNLYLVKLPSGDRWGLHRPCEKSKGLSASRIPYDIN